VRLGAESATLVGYVNHEQGCAVKVALLGGSGFVGRHVAERLSSSGFDVVTVDRAAPAQLFDGESVIIGDLGTADGAAAVAKEVGAVDSVVYLAASISQVTGIDLSAFDDLRIMVEAPLHFLSASSTPPRSVVYISSIQVYGRPRFLPVTEEHPTDPFTAYGVAKLSAEHYLRLYCGKNNIVLTALRLAFIYGPGQHAKNVIPKFIAQVRSGERPAIRGDGREIRDDVHVRDIALAVECAIKSGIDGSFNISSGQPHTLLDVANAICELSGNAELTPVTDNQISTWADRWYSIAKAQSELGFTPAISFEQGLQEMWAKQCAE
jgi:UDP-glucose 4-epimerase